jgi:nucleoside-diphosphate-sugar epimerase
MAAFAVTGSSTPLGTRVVAGLAARGTVAALAAASTDEPGARSPGGPDAFHGTSCLVSLAVGPGPSPEAGGAAARLAGLREALAAAATAGVGRVVHLSSAVVYGASADNAVPLTEDAPVRPDLAFPWAVELAEAERLVAEWRDGGAGRTAAVLRPALVVAPGDDGFLPRALGGMSGPRTAGDSRPVQFVHIDDVAAAVVACATAEEPVDGPLNVAPDGWIGDEDVSALAGNLLPPPSLPARLVGPARRLLWAVGAGATPPEAEAYASHPWVVAADRLRALGWEPTHSAEEAIVATTTCSPLAAMPPGRRQQLLLSLTAALIGGLLLALVAATLRAVRGR